MKMIDEELISPEEIKNNMSADILQQMISEVDTNFVGAFIYTLCENLHQNHGGNVPQTKAGLLALNLDETIASLMMLHVFAAPELVVCLHARKILTAIDLIDWEETGVEEKREVKMAKLPAERVRKSLFTWLPRGKAMEFYDTMNHLGNLIGHPVIGSWGMVTAAINSNFTPKDKTLLDKMVNQISQIYVATKSGGGGKSGFCC